MLSREHEDTSLDGSLGVDTPVFCNLARRFPSASRIEIADALTGAKGKAGSAATELSKTHRDLVLEPRMDSLCADLERVASSFNNDSDGEADSMNIQLLSNVSGLGDAQIQVSEGQIVGDAIQAAYPDLRMKAVLVSTGGEEIDMELTFSENGIEDGARLEVGGLPSSPFWFFLVLFFLFLMRTALLAPFFCSDVKSSFTSFALAFRSPISVGRRR